MNFNPDFLVSLLPPELAQRVAWGSLTDYDVVLRQTTTINGGAATEGNSDAYTLESGYVFFNYGRSGDVYSPAAMTQAGGEIDSIAGMRWLWEGVPAFNATANREDMDVPTVSMASIQFKVNADVRANEFQPFQTFCGPNAALPRVLPMPVVLLGQTPLTYRLQNNAPADYNCRSNVVLHCLRASMR